MDRNPATTKIWKHTKLCKHIFSCAKRGTNQCLFKKKFLSLRKRIKHQDFFVLLCVTTFACNTHGLFTQLETFFHATTYDIVSFHPKIYCIVFFQKDIKFQKKINMLVARPVYKKLFGLFKLKRGLFEIAPPYISLRPSLKGGFYMSAG